MEEIVKRKTLTSMVWSDSALFVYSYLSVPMLKTFTVTDKREFTVKSTFDKTSITTCDFSGKHFQLLFK